MGSQLALYRGQTIDLSTPTPLYISDHHTIYWIGIEEETAFRCNVYLIDAGDEKIIVDPGSRMYFQQVYDRIAQVIDPKSVTGLIACHQDPDVAASMIDWIGVNPDIMVFSSARAHVLLPHYGCSTYNAYDIAANPTYTLSNGHTLQFLEAPFLHFPGAFATYDVTSRFLLSGDIWAALDTDWKLVSDNFASHKLNMDLFHLDYMASGIAARGFARKLDPLAIDAILPQHGSIFDTDQVYEAITYLKTLHCGLDLIYPDLS